MDGWLQAGGTDGLAAICTNTVASNYQACYSCEVKAGALTAQAAQSTVDGSCFVVCGLRYFLDADEQHLAAYVNGCKTGGHPINGFTISADGSISGGAASGAAPAASGASPAASGAPASSPAKKGNAVRASAGILGAASAFVFVVLGTVV
jgi:hypothetical protein